MNQLSALKRYDAITKTDWSLLKGYKYFRCSSVEAIMPRWVSVDERLPEKKGRYYCISTEEDFDGKMSRHASLELFKCYNDFRVDEFQVLFNTVTHWLDNVPPAPEQI